MKRVFLIILFIQFVFLLQGQISDTAVLNLDTNPKQGMGFRINSIITIKLYPIDSVNFNFKVIKSDYFNDTIKLFGIMKYLNNSEKNTIEFIFCNGYNSIDKDNKIETYLLIKNNYDFLISYKADIARNETSKFKSTSVVDLHPYIKSTEMWPYRIELIALYDFKKLKYPK